MSFTLAQASSEHPLAKAIVEYARHFHFFDEPSATNDATNQSKEPMISGWLFDVSDFSALPGRGIQCLIDGKLILVSSKHMAYCICLLHPSKDADQRYCVLNRLVIGN